MSSSNPSIQRPRMHHWVYPKQDPDFLSLITNELNIHPMIAQVLVSRGFSNLEEIHNHLYAKLPNLYSPELLQEIDQAVERIYQALKRKEKILVYGDNDVDGITGTALLVEFFRSIGIATTYMVPNRNRLKQSNVGEALAIAKEKQCSLLVTVDCGISAPSEIEKFVNERIDVIITDHHEPTAAISRCTATLNPKLFNSEYPNRELTGVGVAFKLAHAVTNFLTKLGEISASRIDLKKYLDLVALGTIADMGGLKGENRILVRYGLKQLSHTKRIGLTKLLTVCAVNEEEMSSSDIASKVAPRLNSLGRIDDPEKGVELLLLRDPFAAERLAQELDLNNIERQKIERRDAQDIERYIRNNPQVLAEKVIFLHSPKWHPGIIPILAARISKQYNRPTFVIAMEEGVGKGSSRTIPEFPLLPPMHECAPLLLNYGGHNFAAGFTIKEENLPEFRARFLSLTDPLLGEQDLVPKLFLDAPVNFDDLTFEFLESLHLLEPYGNENPPPLFYCEATQTWPPKIVGKNHLKLYLEQHDRVLEGIAFGLADRKSEICRKKITLQIAFTPYVNTFLNKSSIQLLIRDFKVLE